MANFVSMKVEGADLIAKRLKRLDRDLRVKAYSRALSKATDVILKSARKKVPVGRRNITHGATPGTLKRSLTKRVRVNYRIHRAEVGWRQGRDEKDDAFYGHMVEYGTRYTTAQPFMRPALDENEDKVVEAYKNEIQKQLDKAESGYVLR